MIEFFRRLTKSAAAKSNAASVAFHPSSYADPHGRVFRAGGGLFRAVPATAQAFCVGIIEDGTVGALVDQGLLVPTKRSDFSLPGYPLVLEHEQFPHVSYPFEWPGEMLRAAGLHTLDVLEALARRGLTLKDAHGWNIVFDGCRPVFVDFGSIVENPAREGWLPHVEQQFRDFFLNPLELIAAGHVRIARALMRDFERGIGDDDCRGLVAGAVEPMGRPFSWYRERIASLALHKISKGWSGYYDGEFPSLEPGPDWNAKHEAVHRALLQFRPATVLDIGANRGWYSMLAAKSGARVTAYDTDEVCVDLLFSDARKSGLSVQPLVMSCVNPSPRYGLAGGVMESAEERLRSDLVLGLALVHHMVFKMHLDFERIAAAFSAYAGKALVVEFPPPDDIHVSQWMSERYAWYTQENFTSALRKYFSKITSIPSHPTPRIILFCER